MHPAIQQMLDAYKPIRPIDYERAIKEIIQEIALVGLWRAKFFEHAAFFGGTSLRILHGLDRYSEDLDFTLLKSTPEFDLAPYNEAIKHELLGYDFNVSVDQKIKIKPTSIQSAFIKANTKTELLKVGIPQDTLVGVQREQSIKIKLEVDSDPPLGFTTESRFLLQPINVAIRTLTLSDLFAGKMHALLCRKWGQRVKGRDWYDWAWFVRLRVPLNLDYLGKRMRQTGDLPEKAIFTKEDFLIRLKERIESVDLERAKADMLPFQRDEATTESWSKELFLFLAQQTKVYRP